MRSGRRIAFDVGMARIGVAVSDPQGILASPREFIKRDQNQSTTLELMLKVVAQEEPIEIYVGLPLNLQNKQTLSTQDAVGIASGLQQKCDVPVRLVDERMTTRIASSAMSGLGKTTREQRGTIDSAAAAVILEHALQFERANGQIPGTSLGAFDSGN